jgi:hypothetical protein
VEITGSELRSIDAEAFDGIEENYELVLQIRGTQIEELPAGLFAKLEKIPHLSLDLRDNKFSSLSPGTLYSNGTSWENVGTKLISGKSGLHNLFSCCSDYHELQTSLHVLWFNLYVYVYV